MSEMIRIADVMTPLPVTIDLQQTLFVARKRMQEIGVRHLPVLDGGRLVGLISSRDIDLASGLGADLAQVVVGVAMSAGPYAVGPKESLGTVIARMHEDKVGSVLVVENERVIGLFTTVDALWLLSSVLQHESAVTRRQSVPSDLRSRLAKERALIEQSATSARGLAEAALKDDASAADVLPQRARELYQELLRYMDVVDELLVPVLAQTPVSGTIRGELLLHRHKEQRRQIHVAQAWLQQADPEHLAESLIRLCERLLKETSEHDADLMTIRLHQEDVAPAH